MQAYIGWLYVLNNYLYQLVMYIYGREEGIRTLETFRFTHFPGVLLQPLGHLSKNFFISTYYLISVYSVPKEHAACSLCCTSCASPLWGHFREASKMFKIAPGNFSQLLGHLSKYLYWNFILRRTAFPESLLLRVITAHLPVSRPVVQPRCDDR